MKAEPTPGRVLILHHDDLDGICAAAIACMAYREKDKCPVCMPVNYNTEFPTEEVERAESVVMLDFTAPLETMLWLRDRESGKGRLEVWIDHHRTALKVACEMTDVPGIRADTQPAACELTWSYFTGKPVPKAVRMISLWDTWDHDNDPDILHLRFGIEDLGWTPEEGEWADLFEGEDIFGDDIMAQVINRGEIVLGHLQKRHGKLIDENAYIVDFEGHRCLAVNLPRVNSMYFERSKMAADPTVEAFMPWFYDGNGQFVVNLYQNAACTEKIPNLGELAAKYGGGGHPGAAGFQVRELPACLAEWKGPKEEPPL